MSNWKSLIAVVALVGILYFLSTGIPNKLMLQLTVYALMGVLIYHLYNQLEEYRSKNALKKIMGRLYKSFPESGITEEELAKLGVPKSAVSGLAKLGFMSSEGKGKYAIGEKALHIMSIWQIEHLNRQIFVLTIAILVISIMLVLSKMA